MTKRVRYGARVISIPFDRRRDLGLVASVSLAIGVTLEHRLYRVIVPVASIAVFAWGFLIGTRTPRCSASRQQAGHGSNQDTYYYAHAFSILPHLP